MTWRITNDCLLHRIISTLQSRRAVETRHHLPVTEDRPQTPKAASGASRMVREIRILSPAVLEQAFTSLAGFISSALVARLLGAEALAIFAIGTSIIFGVGAVVNSLVLDPSGVIGPRDHDDHIRSYGGLVILASVAFGVVSGLIGLGFLALPLGEWGAVAAVSLISALPMFVAWATRRLPYLTNQPLIAMASSLTYLVVVVAVLLVAFEVDVLSATSAIAVLGVGAGAQAAVVFAVWRPKFSLASDRTVVTGVTREHWRFGKWYLATEASSWVTNYGLTAISAAVIDLTSAGAIRASQVLLRPFGIVFAGVGLALLPRLTRIQRDRGHDVEIRTAVRKMAWLLSGIGIVSFIVFLIAGTQIMGLVFGPELAPYGWFVTVLSSGLIIHGWTSAYSLGLQAANRPQDVFVANVWSAIASLVLGIPLLLAWGLVGAAIAPLLSGLVRFFITLRLWNRVPDRGDLSIGDS
jgi:O-antigen/teichoic acid export membrane protein